MKKLTLKVTKTAFYNGALVYPNEIIKNYSGAVPSWATLANGEEIIDKVNKNNNSDNENTPPVEAQTGEDGSGENETPVTDNNAEGETGESGAAVEQTGVTEEKLMEEYNKLVDEAVDKNILIEDADKK